ncbi:Pyridine nucleotide-disulphide oxidoreductase [Lentzea albidocapillata subsp. violacea]|uniref:Pyridine nucleotide-disulphide oxidoreductase n=1 Tax=Lentzea albidocapillata subsp. violacea TaxID=128104 RepID=A0A1G8RIQ6_9PSEU|nr:NAD(P)-binding domain-containing protein [Lentzea albidocapillata]SDJ16858.1 Pyridine nucleotide-disulphide oxidoreductase [Lentzea albidocapillata subsp. violacea]
MAHDYLIIGAGPAGLQLAALLERDGRDYAVLERGSGAGTFFTRYPRHRKLISINKVHTGFTDPEQRMRMDWNSLLLDDPELLFTRYTPRYFPDADDIVRYFQDCAANLKVHYDVDVTSISRDDDGFAVTDHSGRTWHAGNLVMATGVSQLYVPPIPGIEHAERYDTFDTDPESFTGQRVLVIGKGNSGFETADALVEHAAVIHVAGPHSVKLAWQTHYVGHLRAVNNNFLDTYQLKSENAVIDGTVERIEQRPEGGFRIQFRYARTVENVRELEYDRIIACTGFQFDASIFAENCRPALIIKDRFPRQTSAFESANIPGLYFAGTITQSRDFKKSTSGFIHGFRYGARALHRVLSARNHGTPWQGTDLELSPEAISEAVIARVNRSSCLWQQFAVMGDVVSVDGAAARYSEEVPVAFVADGGLGPAEHRFVATLEYGPDHDTVDPFDISIPRVAENDPVHAADASYLHPVVRYYRHGVLAATHHLAENLENHWDLPEVHQQPLGVFVKECLAGA